MLVLLLHSLFCPHRHLNLSQTVTLTVMTAGDALERTKLLRRYIEVADLLQSAKYGNLFSFIAVMQGLGAPQVSSDSDIHVFESLCLHPNITGTSPFFSVLCKYYQNCSNGDLFPFSGADSVEVT